MRETLQTAPPLAQWHWRYVVERTNGPAATEPVDLGGKHLRPPSRRVRAVQQHPRVAANGLDEHDAAHARWLGDEDTSRAEVSAQARNALKPRQSQSRSSGPTLSLAIRCARNNSRSGPDHASAGAQDEEEIGRSPGGAFVEVSSVNVSRRSRPYDLPALASRGSGFPPGPTR